MNLNELKVEYLASNLSKAEYISKCFDIHRTLLDYVYVIQETDISEIKIGGSGLEFQLKDFDIKLLCPPNEARIVPFETINFGSYEQQETRVMDILSKDLNIIFDIGANIGWYSLRFAKANSEAKIFSFEPLPESYDFFQKNIALNNLGNQITAFNFGLSDESGAFRFFIEPKNGTNASLRNVADSKSVKEIVGLTLRMDEFVKNYAARPEFIKCDVEGAELLVFKGGKNTLEECKPVVFTELLRKWSKPFDYHPNDVVEFFDTLGYECFAISDKGVTKISVVTDETVETNYVFLHKIKHALLVNELKRLK